MGLLKAKVDGGWVDIGLGNVDEVWVGSSAPTDPNVQMWYDTDAVQPGADWTSYTPTLTAATTNPNLGSTGQIVASYCRIGKVVHWHATFSVGGTGISAGSGQYSISLPLPLGVAGQYVIVGQGWMYGINGFKPLVVDSHASFAQRMLMANGAFLGHADGFSSGAGTLSLSGTYRVA